MPAQYSDQYLWQAVSLMAASSGALNPAMPVIQYDI